MTAQRRQLSRTPNRRTFLASCSAMGVGLAAAPYVISTSKTRAASDSDGFVRLFDGKTLKGWHKNPQHIGHGTGGQWTVEDGVLAGQQDPPGSGNGGILLTDQKFGDFELLIDMKPDWGVCSGLFLRGTDRGQCFQMMVDYHDKGNVGHIYGEGTGGFNTRAFSIDGKYDANKTLTGLVGVDRQGPEQHGLAHTCTAQQWIDAWKLDNWNTARVRVEGGMLPTITTWINGLKVCHFDADSYRGGGYDKEKVLQTLGAEGSVAVQVHGGKGWPNGAKCRWKNIKIKQL